MLFAFDRTQKFAVRSWELEELIKQLTVGAYRVPNRRSGSAVWDDVHPARRTDAVRPAQYPQIIQPRRPIRVNPGRQKEAIYPINRIQFLSAWRQKSTLSCRSAHRWPPGAAANRRAALAGATRSDARNTG